MRWRSGYPRSYGIDGRMLRVFQISGLSGGETRLALIPSTSELLSMQAIKEKSYLPSQGSAYATEGRPQLREGLAYDRCNNFRSPNLKRCRTGAREQKCNCRRSIRLDRRPSHYCPVAQFRTGRDSHNCDGGWVCSEHSSYGLFQYV